MQHPSLSSPDPAADERTQRERLDRALARSVPGLSRGEARRLIAAGAVFVNGRRCKVAGRLVRDADRLRVERGRTGAEPEPLEILYEDDQLIAVDKPAGMPSAPTRTAAAGTAVEVLGSQLRRRDGRTRRLWLIHRLDAETSGVLLFALGKAAAAFLSESFRARRVEKEYLALVEGLPSDGHGRIELPLLSARGRSRVDPAGRRAVTEWVVVRGSDDRALLLLRPETGRMHQLRVHLAAVGHPVVGDRLYGGPPAARLLLHARSLRFRHPRKGVAVEIDAAAPRELTTGSGATRPSAS